MMDITFQDAVQLITNVGFPIFVALWLLYYGNKRQKEMSEALNDLKFEIEMNRKMIEHFLTVEAQKKEETK